MILTFSPGTLLNGFSITIVTDSLVEGNEQFFGNLREIPGSPVVLSPDVASVTIIDDDSTYVPQVDEEAYMYQLCMGIRM